MSSDEIDLMREALFDTPELWQLLSRLLDE